MPVALHSIIELFALAVIGLGLALKLRWMGWLTILKHKRTMLKVSVTNSTVIDSSILYFFYKFYIIMNGYIFNLFLYYFSA